MAQLHAIRRRPHVDDGHLAQPNALIRQLLARRGVTSEDESLALANLLSPHTMLGLSEAAAIVTEAIVQQKRILIVGDFDADGATSTAVCMLALKRMGANNVDFLIPNRFDYGYGLSPELVTLAHQQHAQLLITVDNGISSISGVAAARALGIDVVVTDHHLPGDALPQANAIVNPNQHGCPFASKALAGCGVAFYLMSAIRAKLKQSGWFTMQQPMPNLAELLDIVALGTVADLVSLDSNNRILVKAGLARVRSGRCRPGILELLTLGKRRPQATVASDFAFAVAPRLNAAGRLDEMALGVELLLCDDAHQAKRMAAQLDLLNQERRALEQDMQQDALAHLHSLQFGDDNLPWGLALYDDSWHQGVIGILASRLKERYHRPVIAFADGDEHTIKGSARSIPGLHMRDLLELINSRHPGMLIKFGGHAMAAGLTIAKHDLAQFQQAYLTGIQDNIDESILTGEILSDGELSAADITLANAQAIRECGPWGQAFPEPVFDGEFYIVSQRIVGERHLKLVLRSHCGQLDVDGIAFNIDVEHWPDARVSQVRVVYRLDVNEFRGHQSVQMMVQQLEKL
ncbi:single-stranded-DNA-specific exonuclease RecJ [Paraferrimonas haliotis]|uniref:Single-stranded-DNA-specific exonuclease RecJ n=1 Tax=Paraferrimonas haliotis TaxID=2013866 RepID=A0AA37TRR7_9GAMM|nr:single-stranded-DNA-specific exonuclease RecJ [Paraferrimonas haliotis]GLS83067.1 single-stranded-DNA-specific exonuclease RecJ [Paraferrimonas haliotis]